jgi:colicin import membrane protein
MENRDDVSAYSMGAGIDSRTLVFYLGLSLIIHLAFIGSVVYMPEPKPRPRLGQGAINVSLVSLPGPPKAATAPAASPAPEPAPKPAAKTVPAPKPEIESPPKVSAVETPPPKPIPPASKPAKTVSLGPKTAKPKIKTSLKKKTRNRQKMIHQALTRVQKNVDNSQPDSVRQAIDRLKKKVAQSEARNTAGASQAAKEIPGATGTGVTGASGAGGRRTLEITDIYKIEIAYQVERHWAFSQQVAGEGRTLQASIVFRVLPNGDISEIRFTQKSGNAYFDDSVYKAVVKASPVSPHPEAIRVPYVEVPIRFTPEGIRK